MKYSLGGVDYDLVFNVHTMELIENEEKEVSQTISDFRRNSRNIHNVKAMFRVMANSGRWLKGLPEDVTGDEIGRLGLKGLDTLSRAMNLTVEESLHSETTGGNEADDEKHDLVLEALEAEKNG